MSVYFAQLLFITSLEAPQWCNLLHMNYQTDTVEHCKVLESVSHQVIKISTHTCYLNAPLNTWAKCRKYVIQVYKCKGHVWVLEQAL